MKFIYDELSSSNIFDDAPTSSSQPVVAKSKTVKSMKLVVTGLFAGVGGLEEGFRQAGHKSTMLCELDPLARYILRKHFPDTEITNDVTTLKSLPECDVLTAGFPCQDLSQVGRRKGIAGPNSGLIKSMFDLLKGQTKSPQWIVLENVPFMLNLDRGRAIRTIVQPCLELRLRGDPDP